MAIMFACVTGWDLLREMRRRHRLCFATVFIDVCGVCGAEGALVCVGRGISLYLARAMPSRVPAEGGGGGIHECGRSQSWLTG